MPPVISRVCPSGQFLTVWSRWVIGDLGDVDRHLRRALLAGGDHLGPVEHPDGVDAQVDRRVHRVTLEGQERAELEDDALVELVGPGRVALARRALALHAAGEACAARPCGWSEPGR